MKKLLSISLFIISSLALANPGAPIPDRKPPSLKTETTKTGQQKPVREKSATRGQLLYKNHCGVCHESNVHIRDKKKARTVADINSWVSKWSTYRKLEWSEEDIRAVVDYLNHTYYQYTK